MTNTKKFLSFILAALIFSGGCGGHTYPSSSGNSNSSIGNNQTQTQTVPNTNTNTNTYSINNLTGTWRVTNAQGTARGEDGDTSHFTFNATITFGEIDSSGTTTVMASESGLVIIDDGYRVEYTMSKQQ